MFGIEIIFFVVIFGVLVFVIGMVFQGSLGYFVSGVLFLVFKFYKVGDLVMIGGGQIGIVEGI